MPIISLPDGHNAEFPDDMPTDQIKAVIQKKYPPQSSQGSSNQPQLGMLDRASNWAEQNINQPVEQNVVNPIRDLATNVSAGAIHGMSEMLPDLSTGGIPKEVANKIGMRTPNVDIYKAMGTSDQPFYTIPGAEQLAGELIMPGKIAGKIAKEAYPIAKNAITKLIDKISPDKHAEQIGEFIGQGAKNVPENSTSLGNDIRNGYNMRNEEASTFLNHATDRAGKEEIYDTPNPLITTQADKAQNIIGKIKGLGDFNTNDLFNSFKQKQSFENAHNLQSELEDQISSLEQKIVKN